MLSGRGGGGIWVDVLLEADCGHPDDEARPAVVVPWEMEELRGERGTVFKSGAMSLLLWSWNGTSVQR